MFDSYRSPGHMQYILNWHWSNPNHSCSLLHCDTLLQYKREQGGFKSHFKFHFNFCLKMDFWNIISHNRKFIIFVATSQTNRCCRIVQVWQDWGWTEGWVRCKLKIGLLYLHPLVHPKEVILREITYSRVPNNRATLLFRTLEVTSLLKTSLVPGTAR